LRFLGFSGLQVGEGGVVDRIESAELKMEKSAVDSVALVGDSRPREGIVSAAVVGGRRLVIPTVSWGQHGRLRDTLS